MNFSNEQKHTLYKILIESFNRCTNNGMSIYDWVEHVKDLGCVLYPEPKNMMLASMGLPTNYKPIKVSGCVGVYTNCFGIVYFPKEFAFKVLVVGFMP